MRNWDSFLKYMDKRPGTVILILIIIIVGWCALNYFGAAAKNYAPRPKDDIPTMQPLGSIPLPNQSPSQPSVNNTYIGTQIKGANCYGNTDTCASVIIDTHK